jgi:predicted nicotinamide N-methyase
VTASPRAFVLRNTRLKPVPGLDAIRLHLADEVLPLWRSVQVETGDPEAALPYWAFAWAGGLAVGQHLQAPPDVVVARRVFDLASGSGICAIAAMQAGAANVAAADIDAFAAAAIECNARVNGARVTVVHRDVLDDDPPNVDVILAGDCWYEASLAERVLPWLQAAAAQGIEIVVGDPGRRYLPTIALTEVARYDVQTTTELEDLGLKEGRVFAMRG